MEVEVAGDEGVGGKKSLNRSRSLFKYCSVESMETIEEEIRVSLRRSKDVRVAIIARTSTPLTFSVYSLSTQLSSKTQERFMEIVI